MSVTVSLILVLVSLISRVPADDLQCYDCRYYKFETENVVLGPILNGLSGLSDDHCQLDSSDDKYEVTSRLCPPAEDGQVMKCVKIDGEVQTAVSLGIAEIDFKYVTITRDCVSVDPNDDDTKDGCHDELPSYGPIRSLLTSALSSLSLGEVRFDGQACYSANSFSNGGCQLLIPTMLITAINVAVFIVLKM